MKIFRVRNNSTLYGRIVQTKELLTFWAGDVLILLGSDSEHTLFLTSEGHVARTPMPLQYISVLVEVA